jgi:hypothetical protein
MSWEGPCSKSITFYIFKPFMPWLGFTIYSASVSHTCWTTIQLGFLNSTNNMIKFASLKTHICTPAYTAFVSYESRELGSCPSHLARHRIALAADSSSTILASFVQLFTWNVLCVGNGTNRPMACSLLCTLWECLWILSWKGCLHLPLPWSLYINICRH